MRSTLLICAILFCSFYVISFLEGCGQSIPPTGGPRDTLPPVLVAATPKDSALNYTGNKITLQFDEYIQLDNPLEKVIISPLPKYNPQINGKLKEVTIKLKDTLDPNTTYSINFGESLKDINENNVYKNFTYIFSTGNNIDNYKLNGKVIIAETGKADSTLIVVLQRSLDDSAVAKERPRYYTRLNREGFFNFYYLAPGVYNVFALKDVDGGKKYDQKSELIGFIEKPVTVGPDNVPILLYAFSEVPEEKRPQSGTTRQGGTTQNSQDKRFRFVTSLENSEQDILTPFEIKFERKIKSYDTSKIHFTDEQLNRLPLNLDEDTTQTRLTFSHTWKEDTKYNLIFEKEFAEDSLGNKILRNDTLRFKTKKQTDYGSVRLRFINLDTSEHLVMQLFKNDLIFLSQPITGREINYRLFKPGEYEMRILYDRNQNGHWDTGNYWTKQQPERVVVRPQKLTIRPNFDNILDINIQELQN